MLNSSLLKKHGVTPAKLVVIGVLAVVLVGVIVLQIPSGKPVAKAAGENEPSAEDETAAEGEKVTLTSAKTPEAVALVAWPKLPLEKIAQHDPFRLPPELRKELRNGLDSQQSPQEGNNPQLLNELTTAGAAIVIVRDGQHVARVGANTLRPGDIIGGYRVWKIDAQGVWLVDDNSSQK